MRTNGKDLGKTRHEKRAKKILKDSARRGKQRIFGDPARRGKHRLPRDPARRGKDRILWDPARSEAQRRTSENIENRYEQHEIKTKLKQQFKKI